MVRRTISIDEKIERAKETVSRAKTKYDAALDELEKLMVKKEEMKKQELMAAIESSNKSFDEVMAFLKEEM